MHLDQLFLVFVLTFLFSFGVQFCFYLYYKKFNPIFLKGNKHVLQYFSGIIGDGILVPGINIFAVLSIANIEKFQLIPLVTWSLFLGVIITFAFHFGQQYFRLTNWTMTEVGKWNLLGLYHSIFMFFESSFLVFCLLIFLNSGKNDLPIKYGLILLFLFVLSFIYDYRKTLLKTK